MNVRINPLCIKYDIDVVGIAGERRFEILSLEPILCIIRRDMNLVV